jgi:hypothetical protein
LVQKCEVLTGSEIVFLSGKSEVIGAGSEIRDWPECMDRLRFASEGVLAEVADMYPAC